MEERRDALNLRFEELGNTLRRRVPGMNLPLAAASQPKNYKVWWKRSCRRNWPPPTRLKILRCPDLKARVRSAEETEAEFKARIALWRYGKARMRTST